MASRHFPNVVFSRTLIVICCMISITAVCSIDSRAFALRPAAAQYNLSEIYKKYFYLDEREEGLKLLSKAVYAKGALDYRKGVLDTVLTIIKDYYTLEEDPKNFEGIIREVFDYTRERKIRGFFIGSRLQSNVENAIQEWKTPTKIIVKTEFISMKPTGEIELGVEVYNNKNKALNLEDVQLTFNIHPEGIGTIDEETNIFTAAEPGEARITVITQGASGEVRNSIKIDILHEPPEIATIDPLSGPGGIKVTIKGKKFDPDPEKDTVLFNKIEAPVESASDSLLSFKVPMKASLGENTITVETTLGAVRSDKQFTVTRAPVKPSKKWAYVSTGAFAASGAAYVYFTGKARDESSKCEEQAAVECPDYDDASLLEKISGSVAIAAGITTAYFWYKYIKSNSKYKSETEKLFGESGVGFEPYRGGIIITYRF